MNKNQLVTYGAVIIAIVTVVVVVLVATKLRKRPKKLDQVKFKTKWDAVQAMLPDNKMWPLAIIDADKLLDEALKGRKYKGKTMGERLVSAQRDITSNDSVWFAHKLRNKLVHDQDVKLHKSDVKDALLGVRGALKDIGALK